jgi:hypothetical protein
VNLSDFVYVGGGYFRKNAPKGESAETIHGPELLALAQRLEAERDALRAEVERLKAEANVPEACVCCIENDCDCMEGVTWDGEAWDA